MPPRFADDRATEEEALESMIARRRLLRDRAWREQQRALTACDRLIKSLRSFFKLLVDRDAWLDAEGPLAVAERSRDFALLAEQAAGRLRRLTLLDERPTLEEHRREARLRRVIEEENEPMER